MGFVLKTFSFIVEILFRFYQRMLEAVVVPSAHVLESVSIRTRIVVQPTPVEAAQSGGKVVKRNNAVCVCRLSREKRVENVLLWFQEALARREYKRLVIVGDGPWRRKTQNRCLELGIAEHVDIMGSLTHMDTLKIMNEARVFVTSSIFESQGLAEAEAKALGLPIVRVGEDGVVDPEEKAWEATNNNEKGILELIALYKELDTIARDIRNV